MWVGPTDYVEGEVIEEYGTLAALERSPGGLFCNESVRLGSSYGIVVETADGTYSIDIVENGCHSNYGQQTPQNLAAAIDEGTQVRFPERVLDLWSHKDCFSDNNLGTLDPEYIDIR